MIGYQRNAKVSVIGAHAREPGAAAARVGGGDGAERQADAVRDEEAAAAAQLGEAAVKAVGLEAPVAAAAPQRLGRDLEVIGAANDARGALEKVALRLQREADGDDDAFT